MVLEQLWLWRFAFAFEVGHLPSDHAGDRAGSGGEFGNQTDLTVIGGYSLRREPGRRG